MKVTCLVKRWEHHTASGGYDRLAKELEATTIVRQTPSSLFGQITRKLWQDRTGTNAYLLDYQLGDLVAEVKTLAHAAWIQPDIVHVLYGDEQLDRLLRHRSLLRSRLVATFHLPIDRVASRLEQFQSKLGRGIDAAVVVARSQCDAYQKWVGEERVVYIPHGIDTVTFRPQLEEPVSKKTKILMVGDHRRDWEVMHQVIDHIRKHNTEIEFHVVTKTENRAYFTGCKDVRFHADVSERELITHYQTSDALFVPVAEATANNSVLEALACGTPVISNEVGGIPDYVDPTCGWLFPRHEVRGVVDLLQRMCAEKSFLQPYRRAARAHALKFDWKEVAEQILVVYQAVLRGEAPSHALKKFRDLKSPENDPSVRIA